jgi:hypothetical protein
MALFLSTTLSCLALFSVALNITRLVGHRTAERVEEWNRWRLQASLGRDVRDVGDAVEKFARTPHRGDLPEQSVIVGVGPPPRRPIPPCS